MIKQLKAGLSNIREIKREGIEQEPFNGFGFMRRIYGIEEAPDLDSISPQPSASTTDNSSNSTLE
ncbi:MAG: hypothetical protein OQK25_04245 [Gammaproteobacteria bacterium]|nr:hypothetical protein [Gammaproteobacteria bacterium]